MENPTNTQATVIEAAIEQLGVDPKICRTDEPNKWYLHRGDAQVVMLLRESKTHTGDNRETLVIVSPVLPLPEGDEQRYELYNYLLSMTHKMVTESFSIAEGWVYLSATYFAQEMEQKEVSALLDSLSYYAQLFAQELRAKYQKEEAK